VRRALGIAAAVVAVAASAGCGGSGSHHQTVPGGNAEHGERLIEKFGCGSCHTIPNIPGASGTIGPNLGPHDNVPPLSQRNPIATYPNGTVPNTSVDDLAKWIQNPQALKPGTAMPTLGLSADEAAAAAAYLYSIQPGQ
jgi:cytochrome c2